MLALRSPILFSTFILIFFIAVAQSLQLPDGVSVQILGKPHRKRAGKPQNPLPCPPDGHPKAINLRDPGSSVGVLPYTPEMVNEGNAKYAASLNQSANATYTPNIKLTASTNHTLNTTHTGSTKLTTSTTNTPNPTYTSNAKLTLSATQTVNQTHMVNAKLITNTTHTANITKISKTLMALPKRLLDIPKRLKTLSKRIGGQLRIWYGSALIKVGTDRTEFMIWSTPTPGGIKNLMMATGDLSGCTVLIVTSPYTIIMVHVWERRAEPYDWLWYPNGPAQKANDAAFIAQGVDLLRQSLHGFGGSVADGFDQWFPLDSTVVQIIAPAYNPDYALGTYEDAGARTNPWYTMNNPQNPLGLIYPSATVGLQTEALNMVIPGRGSMQALMGTYRRRFSSDIKHGMDDREYIVIKPMIMPDGEIWAVTHYDDDKAAALARLA